MKLKNIDFGYVLGQSGIQGFYGLGDEYRHHAIYKFLFGWLGFSFDGMTFVAKTTSLYHRTFPDKSQTALIDGYKLKEWLPKSIWISMTVNHTGLCIECYGYSDTRYYFSD
jgi:hypothetical protein